MKKELEIGDKVVRGPNWKWGNQDGGKGNTGKITSVNPKNWYIVEWSSGDSDAYIYQKGDYQITLAEIPEEVVVKLPEEVTVKAKKMNNSEFKNALKGL